MSQLEISSVIGQPLREGWSHVISNPSQNFICVLAVGGKNANNIGRSLTDTILSDHLEDAKDVHHLILDLLRETRNNGNRLELALILLDKDQAIFATYNGQILLKRQSENQEKKYQIGTLIRSENRPKMIIGRLRSNDTLALMTQQITKLETKLNNQLKRKSELDQIATELVTRVHDQENSSLSAVALVKAKQTDLNQDSQQSSTEATTGKKKLQPFLKKDSQLSKPRAVSTQRDRDKQKEKNKQKTESAHSKSAKISLIHLIVSPLKIILDLVRKMVSLLISVIAKLSVPKLDLKKIKASLSFNPLEKLNSKKQIYLNQNTKRKTVRIVVAVLVISGALLGGFSLYQRKIRLQKERVNQEIETAQTLLEEAKQLEQNQLIKARAKTQQAIEILTAEAKKYQQNRVALSIINQKLSKAEEFYESISGQNQLNQLDIFFDLREIAPNFSTTHLATNQNDLFFLDQGQQQVIQLTLANKEANVIDLPKEIQAIDLTASEKTLYLLGQGIFSLSLDGEEAVSDQIKTEGDSDRAATLIRSFSSYLYVFNPKKRNIYRYIIKNDGELSDPIGWLTDKTGLEFGSVNDMSINGFIWLTDNQGAISKLSKGEPITDFSITGLEQNIGENPKIATGEELDNILILDPNRERILILNQDGEFLQEVTSPSLASTKQIGLFPQESIALVVSGSIVYSIPLDQN